MQLINRNRTAAISLTPAGEFWYRSSIEVMDRMHALLQKHDQSFRSANLVRRHTRVAWPVHESCGADRAAIAEFHPVRDDL